MNEQPGLLAQKLGMTQIFLEDGTRVPVTVLSVKGNTVLAHRTVERHGYAALQIGFNEQKAERLTKPALGQFKAAGVSPRKWVHEIRVPAEKVAEHSIGSDIPATLFNEGELVDVIGTSKGKGFAGGFKRHHHGGKNATHGTHEYFRHAGSIGCRLTPGRVFPGKRMPGHLGDVRVTEENLKVVKILAEEGVLLVRGPVPGAKNAYVTVRRAHKPAIRAAHKAAK